MATVKLNEAKLLKTPRGREELWDTSVAGLFVRGGSRGWVFNFRSAPVVGPDGKVRRPRVTLGPWSPVAGLGLSLKEARIRAAGLAGRIVEAPTAKPGETVRALAEDFVSTRYPINAVRRAKVEALLECHALPTIGGMAVAQVTRQHCMGLVKAAKVERRVKAKGSVRRGGRAPAVALIRVLRQLFDHAVKTGKIDRSRHPADLLEERDFGIGEADKRERFLTAEELATLFLHKEIDLPGLLAGKPGLEFGLSTSVRAAIILGPYLAVRPAALIGLRWDEVDLAAATATIRGGRGAKLKHGKKPKDFVVPLSTTAVDVLNALKQARIGDSPYVFASASKVGHLTGDVYADAMKRLSARLNLPGGEVHPHDARRTFTAAAERLGISKLVVDRVLQHSLGKVGDTYFVGDEAETRRSAHERVDANWTAVRIGKPAKVVPINSAK